MVRATFVNTASQIKRAHSEVTSGKNSKKKHSDNGTKDAYMNGCRRPFLDCQWSEMDPAKTSDAENLAVIKKQEKAKALSETTLSRLTDPESKFEFEGEFFGFHVLTIYFTSEKMLLTGATARSY